MNKDFDHIMNMVGLILFGGIGIIAPLSWIF